MNNVITLLNKTFAREFYRLNSGFFLLLGTLTFGFMSDVEHRALAQFFLSSQYTMMIPAGVWILYTVMVLHFNHRQLRRDENRVLFNMVFLSPGRQALCAGIFFGLQFLPATGYGIFLVGMACKSGTSLNIFIALFALVACWTIASIATVISLRTPYDEKKTSFIRRYMDRHFHKPFVRFYIEWILRTDPLMVAATKIFSGGLILGVSRLYASEHYDVRFLAMTLTACAMGNLLIFFRLQDFEHTRIAWVKNLPVSLAKRFFTIAAAMVVLLIPEGVLLIRCFPEYSGAYTIFGLLYLLGMACFLFGLLQTRGWSLAAFTKASFWIFVGFILLILFRVPVILLSLAAFAAGYLLFKRNYYLFEPYRNGHQAS